MRSFLTFFSALLITALSFAQNCSITVVNPDGQPFFASLNGVQQHSEPYANVKIAGVTTGTYEVKLTFPDGKTAELNKKILLENVGDYVVNVSGRGKGRTLKFSTWKTGKKVISGQPAVVQYRPNDQTPFSDKTMGAVGSPVIEVGTAIASSMDAFTDSYDPSDTLSVKTHELAYRYFHSGDWLALEKLFTDEKINGCWPPNRGFVTIRTETLKAGTEIDRYGGYTADGQFYDKGNFVSPMGASFASRALPASAKNKPYTKYRIKKDIPDVKAGEAIPWFGEPGMGIQYELPENIDDLLKGGYIEKIE
jgi:hypothetical protein